MPLCNTPLTTAPGKEVELVSELIELPWRTSRYVEREIWSSGEGLDGKENNAKRERFLDCGMHAV